LGLKFYDLPTYADLDLVASKPSYFATQYGITFTNVINQGWTGNFTSSSVRESESVLSRLSVL
jgi:hypothetical protein